MLKVTGPFSGLGDRKARGTRGDFFDWKEAIHMAIVVEWVRRLTCLMGNREGQVHGCKLYFYLFVGLPLSGNGGSLAKRTLPRD